MHYKHDPQINFQFLTDTNIYCSVTDDEFIYPMIIPPSKPSKVYQINVHEHHV